MRFSGFRIRYVVARALLEGRLEARHLRAAAGQRKTFPIRLSALVAP